MAERGVCSECGGVYGLRVDGAVRRHTCTFSYGTDNAAEVYSCPGGGLPPSREASDG